MGRSSGGGSHSSGGFGGGHSSGGFSGGGRSSGGFSRGSGSSHSSYTRRSSGPRTVFVGGPRYYRSPRPPRGPRPRNYGSHSISSVLISIVFICVIIGMLFFSTSSKHQDVPKNTKQREALSGVVKKTDWYDDQLSWIRSPSVLVSGLEDFYQETGIQPYVMMIPYSQQYWNGSTFLSTQADAYLEKVYKERFKDEGHFIFAYFACLNDSSQEMDGEFRYLSGYAADSIMDSEAIDILWGYFQKNYYNTSLSIEKMISETFSATGENIMSAPTNSWDFAKIAIIVGGVVGIGVIAYLIFKKKAQREKEKEDYTKEILDKPLETFGEDTTDLEKKYEDDM